MATPTPSADATAPVPGIPIADPQSLSAQSGCRVGRYELVERLGQGGMGVVWRARDRELGRYVALKLIRDDVDAGARERFLREARLAARLRHPGLVGVHDVGEAGGRAYLAAELVDGRTWEHLREAERAGGMTPPGIDALRAEVDRLAQAAEAVGFAHREGIVHRDLKPANLLVDSGGRVHVADFGLASDFLATAGGVHATSLTATGVALGTPVYMSPEQAAAESDRIGPASDVWALGVILYEILAGRPPHEGDSPHALLRAIVEDPVRPPRSFRSDVDPDLEAICLRALESEPGARYPEAGELEQDLRRWLAGQRVRTRRPSRLRAALRWPMRHPSVAAIAIGIALALAATAVWVRSERAGTTRQRLGTWTEIAATVLAFEDEVARIPLPREARRELAAQPLRLVARRLEQEPDDAVGLAWRGRLREVLGEVRDAELDLDRACELDPRAGVPRLLRGLRRLDRYLGDRGRPRPVIGPAGAMWTEAEPETAEQRSMREGGLADLAIAAAVPEQAQPPYEELARIGRAVAALHSDEAQAGAHARAILGEPTLRIGRRVQGWAFYREERYDDAAAAFARLLAEWPYDPTARLARAESLFAGGMSRAAAESPQEDRLRAADAEYGRAIAAHDSLEARLGRANVRLNLAQTAERRGEDPRPVLVEALADLEVEFENAVELSGDRHAVRGLLLRHLARAEEERGVDVRDRYREALAEFSAAEAQGYDRGFLAVNRSSAWQALGDSERRHGGPARESYRRAAEELDGDRDLGAALPLAWNNRANAWRALGELDASEGNDPSGAFRQAVAGFARALELVPGFALARARRGAARALLAAWEASRGRDAGAEFAGALADFTTALNDRPGDPETLDLRGAALRSLGEAERARGMDPRPTFARALADYDAARTRRPGDARLLYRRALVRHSLAEFEWDRGLDPRVALRAVADDAEAALAIDGGFPDALNLRGTARWFLGQVAAARGEDPRPDYGLARADFESAALRNPLHPDVLANLAGIHLSLGLDEERRGGDGRPALLESLRLCRDLFARRPTDTTVRENAGIAWLQLGVARNRRGEDARDDFRQALLAFDEVLRTDPDRRRGFLWRADAGFALAEAQTAAGELADDAYDGAERDYREAALRGSSEAWIHLGRVLRVQTRFEAAHEAWTRAAGAGQAEAARELIDELDTFLAGAEVLWPRTLAGARTASRAGFVLAARDEYRATLALLDVAIARGPEVERERVASRPDVRAARLEAHRELARFEGRLAAGGPPVPGGARLAEPEATRRRERALDHLEQAVALGLDDPADVLNDPAFAALRAHPRFVALLARTGK